MSDKATPTDPRRFTMHSAVLREGLGKKDTCSVHAQSLGRDAEREVTYASLALLVYSLLPKEPINQEMRSPSVLSASRRTLHAVQLCNKQIGRHGNKKRCVGCHGNKKGCVGCHDDTHRPTAALSESRTAEKAPQREMYKFCSMYTWLLISCWTTEWWNSPP